MARIRTIKPEFFRHEDLYDLEAETGLPVRLAFAGLWCQADREGRFKWRPRSLKTQILPFDDCDFSRVLDALTTRGFIQKYTVDEEEYGFIPSFSDHQVINNREAESEIPSPKLANSSTRASRVPHACPTRGQSCKGEGKGKEGKGKEGEEARVVDALSPAGDSSPVAVLEDPPEEKPDPKDPPQPIPANLDSEQFREAWRLWRKHRKEIKHPLKPTMERAQLKMLSGWGHERAMAALHHTMAMGWQGIREPDPEQRSANSGMPF